MRRHRAAGNCVLWAAVLTLDAALAGQPASRPCVSLPEPGPTLVPEIRVGIGRSGALLEYTWRVALAKSSRSSLVWLLWEMQGVALEAKREWSVWNDKESGKGPPLGSESVGTLALARDEEGRGDIHPGGSETFIAISGKLPGVTLLWLAPRQEAPCRPTTEEEWRVLASKGWTPERLEREIDELGSVEFYAKREIVIAPEFKLGADPPGPEALFEAAMTDLGRLQDYLAVPLKVGSQPVAPKCRGDDLRATANSLEVIRQRALERKNSREEDRPLVEQLFAFYARMREEGKKGSGPN